MSNAIGSDGNESLDAAVLRRLLQHLDSRKDVQNIELMNLAGFCRNCLSKWYQQAADEAGVELAEGEARERIYGMPYDQWKAKYQTPATPEQLAIMNAKSKEADKGAK